MTNSSWYYREMGSRNKKTGKLSYYQVRVTDYKIDDCECPARQFRSYSPCKHMKRLKEKWGITSNFQFIIILIVFSVTGSLAVWVAKPILELVGLDKSAVNPWVFWPIRIAIIFPIYQVMIVVIGALFGQFKFFWAFEKKMLVRFGFKRFKD